ncbi:oxidoreductase [Treponema parvum]|uniref:Oxidoreductase n=1 Tax=Treponema parvum TaxID=138851 RepID=A0A975IF54_9SPIR|nr:nitrogenase component 1 [Treponema parvum]QTQ14578.1 oxidoreductase [Treponema parvum]
MQCCNANFDKCLHYVSPGHGGWGVIRVAALVPESRMLFISPFACGRHGALGGTLAGVKDRISYLFIDESDIVSGNYEEMIPNAVEELFEFLGERPKVLFYFVSCLDDLLGTDHEAVCALLSEKYPDVHFRSCHMNPFQMDTAIPPMVGLQLNIYSLLPEGRKKNPKQINLLGNNEPVNKSCELFRYAAAQGFTVKHITDCKTFEEFESFAESCLNIIVTPPAKKAGVELEERLKIPYLIRFVTYDVEEIKDFYLSLFAKLNMTPVDMTSDIEKAENAFKAAKKVIGDFPIAIDFQAIKAPFCLARVLLQHDFNVQLICADQVLEFDKANYEWLGQNYPDLEVMNPLHPDTVKFEYKGRDFLCIGFDAGYLTGSKHVVDFLDDAGNYGFDGVARLSNLMIKAYEQEADVNKMINDAGLII